MIERLQVVDTARSHEIQQVERRMSEIGFAVSPTRAHHPDQDREALGEAIPWIVTVVLAAPIAAFFGAIGSEAGKDAYGAIKRWVVGLSQASSPHGYGEVEILDLDGSRIDVRPAALPEEALAALLDIDWSTASGKALTWTDEFGWVDSTWHWETVVEPGIEDGSWPRSTGKPGDPIRVRREHNINDWPPA